MSITNRRTSVHFIMRAQGKQKYCFISALLHELKDDAEVIPGTTRPIARQITFEFVCSQSGIEGIVLKNA